MRAPAKRLARRQTRRPSNRRRDVQAVGKEPRRKFDLYASVSLEKPNRVPTVWFIESSSGDNISIMYISLAVSAPSTFIGVSRPDGNNSDQNSGANAHFHNWRSCPTWDTGNARVPPGNDLLRVLTGFRGLRRPTVGQRSELISQTVPPQCMRVDLDGVSVVSAPLEQLMTSVDQDE